MLVRIMYQVPEMFDESLEKVKYKIVSKSNLNAEVEKISKRFTVLGWEFV